MAIGRLGSAAGRLHFGNCDLRRQRYDVSASDGSERK